jgi:hypothetical protein
MGNDSIAPDLLTKAFQLMYTNRVGKILAKELETVLTRVPPLVLSKFDNLSLNEIKKTTNAKYIPIGFEKARPKYMRECNVKIFIPDKYWYRLTNKIENPKSKPSIGSIVIVWNVGKN